MKKIYLYLLLFGVPTFLASVIIAILLFGAVAGVLWLFVLGDNPWPSSANNMLGAMFVLVCMALWVALMSVAYVAGKKQESHAAMNTQHVAISAGVTVLLVLVVVSHQWRVGNIGTKSDGILCSAYCRDKGFMGSGMQPENTGTVTCSCFDAQGREAVIVPMSDVAAEQRK